MDTKLLQRVRESAANRNMSFEAYLDFLRRETYNPNNDLTPAEQWDATVILKMLPKATRYKDQR
jgi:hypothetical protein